MKTQEWKSKDGEKTGTNNFPEVGDKFTSRFESPKQSDPRPAVTKDGKPFIAKNFYIGVTDNEGNEITLTLTEGQYKALVKKGDIKDKIIEFESYTAKWKNKNGVEMTKENCVGARVVE